MHSNPVHARKSVFDPVMRGYHIMYRTNENNHCPGCGHSHWLVGRLLAECAFCGTALPLEVHSGGLGGQPRFVGRSEEHTSELQSLMRISYAVFCLKKKKINTTTQHTRIMTTD